MTASGEITTPLDSKISAAAAAAASAATAASVGCAVDDVICLRKVPNSDIITAAEGVRFAPALLRARPANPLSADGVETPLALLRLGAWQQGAVIIGGQSCESCMSWQDGWVSRPLAVLSEQEDQVLLLTNAAAR